MKKRNKISPDDSDFPKIRQRVDHDINLGHECSIGVLVDGRWFAEVSYDYETVIFNTAQAAAKYLWDDGRCDCGALELLARLGWLTLNQRAIEQAAASGILKDNENGWNPSRKVTKPPRSSE